MTREDFEDEITLILDSETGDECSTQVNALMACYDDQRVLIEQQAKEIERLNEELTVAEMVLRSKGYRKDCDIPACNCGPQWNHGGHAEMRLREISDLLPYANGLTILQRIELLLKKGEHP